MRRFCLGLALCLLPVPALADGPGAAASVPTDASRQDCGGDAYTFAEVVPARPGIRRKGPIMVLPDTLCADLAASPNARIDSLNIVIDPRNSAEERPQPGLPAPAAPFHQR